MTERSSTPTYGAIPVKDGVRFRLWAPTAERVEVVTYANGAEQAHALEREADGHHSAVVRGCTAGTRYRYRLDGGESYPDPASRAQPEGVHGPSEVVDAAAFRWTDQDWHGLDAEQLVIYELHVGTFTPDGTFDAAIARLDHVAALGVNAVEVMPIASFAGARNWGYDGVLLYAPAAPYGGPEGFRRFVDAAHARGLGVILDVVYNHFGPEGNHLAPITGGRFFTERHHTPWGAAVNYDGEGSAAVRAFVLENALHWVHEYHVDGLRLDAAHAIVDDSSVHLLRELSEQMHAFAQPKVVIAEDERNERRLVLPSREGGLGLDAVWADDLHHQLRRLVAGDSEGYFRSYTGTVEDVAMTLRKGWFYEGQHSEHQGGPRGTSADGIRTSAFVHCIQNHDQVGNRALGDRLHHVVSPALYRAASALLLLSPYTPMLWMGQEWAATSPFQYFTDLPEELGKLVTQGRREEFKHFSAFSDPATREKIPDPQAERTFHDSRLKWEEREGAEHAAVLALYRALLELRRREPALRDKCRERFAVAPLGPRTLAMRRGDDEGGAILALVSFTGNASFATDAHETTRAPAGRRWERLLSTDDTRFGGPGTSDRMPDDTITLREAGAVVLRAQ